MTYELMDLPYAADALAPVLSAETIEYHYGKHHQGYVNKLNARVDGSATLEELITTSEGPVFNIAAQIWNHDFYWNCMTPGGAALSSSALKSAIDEAFGSIDELKTAFFAAAGSNFASGWTWLVIAEGGQLEIVNTDDADTPIARGITPILTVDVWEHAYYIDYRNSRRGYLEAWWDIINWTFVETQFAQSA